MQADPGGTTVALPPGGLPMDEMRIDRIDEVCRVCLDDGKANALSQARLDALGEALEHAEKEAKALLLVGRPGCFSAGLELKVIRQGHEPAAALVRAGMQLALRLRESPLPIVAACSGHALAMGAVLLLSADERLGVPGEFKIGLNETAIGLVLPRTAVELARARLSPRQLERTAVHGEIFAPEQALECGFLDRLVAADALEAEALRRSAQLAALPPHAFRGNKRLVLEPALARIRAAFQHDFPDPAR
jgi:enoyl-CoA hydratase